MANKKYKKKTKNVEMVLSYPAQDNNDYLSKEERSFLMDIDSKIRTVSKMNDDFTNPMAKLGINTSAMTNYSSYELTRMTFDYRTLTALYRNDWIAQTICQVPATDMVKYGIRFNSKLSPDELDVFYKAYNNQKQNFINLCTWDRLYAGVVGLPLINGVTDGIISGKKSVKRVLEMPFDEKYINPGSFKGYVIIDRWSGVAPEAELDTSFSADGFGKYKYYTIFLERTGQTMKVHRSWLIIMTGLELPRREKYADAGWGMSVLEPVYDALTKYNAVNESIAELTFKASLRVLKIDNLKQSAMGKSRKFQEHLAKRIEKIQDLQSSSRILALDNSEDFSVQNTSFGTLDKIMYEWKKIIAGASKTPLTKIFGIPGEGISGEDMTGLMNYYDHINSEQERSLRRPLQLFFKMVAKSELGYIPEDLDFEFVYLGDVTNSRKVIDSTRKIEIVTQLFESGAISEETLLKEVKELGKNVGIGTNITQEIIKKANTDVEEKVDENESETLLKEE